jgi:hypothetical protein
MDTGYYMMYQCIQGMNGATTPPIICILDCTFDDYSIITNDEFDFHLIYFLISDYFFLKFFDCCPYLISKRLK